MSAIERRRTGLKTAWRDLATRAQRGEAFGHIRAVVQMWRLGYFGDQREKAVDFLMRGCTRDDLREYKRIFGDCTI